VALVLVAACAMRPVRPATTPSTASPCVPAGRWIDPRTGYATALADVVRRAVAARVVLLGEDHDRAGHHRWQLYVAAAITGAAPHVVLGFEMFPRRVQPALDRWVDGATDEQTFLAESDWTHVWGFDPALYRPLFRFARTQRIPMRALNVERTLVHRVAERGWREIPDDAREGLSTPAPASASYRDRLAVAWHAHRPPDGPEDPAALDRFIDAQLVWDRAMATAIHDALAERPDTVLVALLGRGHVEHEGGVPAQLADLDAPRPLVLLPWNADRPCTELVPTVADLVFGLDDPDAASENEEGA
jgi:uncharacterized iron-regulated protein